MAKQWLWSIGVANKNAQLQCLWALLNDSKLIETFFFTILMVWFCLLLLQIPRSQDLMIFVPTPDDDDTGQIYKLIILPLAHMRGVVICTL